jgi:small subunit ribosomal protein S19
MSRSLWKGPFIDYHLLILSQQLKEGSTSLDRKPYKSQIKVWSRRSMILPEFLNQNFEIHNGKQFISLQVTEDMIGHKFGEFASTRKKTLHKKKIKK